eukprot:TRINITY_DN15086_c1_g1_i1.p1 TRINITY_DN15086_c1_g1~~TRINITY_DN15086_c1_g1_i1.p1  ORF type:complete len:129 (+),score=22.91 TRINITY_DN15086_c1_g1_i1:37-387(+)
MKRNSSVIVEGTGGVDLEGTWSGKWGGSDSCLTFINDTLTVTSEEDEQVMKFTVENDCVLIAGKSFKVSVLPNSSICLTPDTGDSVLLTPCDDVGGDSINLSLVGTSLPSQSKHLT